MVKRRRSRSVVVIAALVPPAAEDGAGVVRLVQATTMSVVAHAKREAIGGMSNLENALRFLGRRRGCPGERLGADDRVAIDLPRAVGLLLPIVHITAVILHRRLRACRREAEGVRSDFDGVVGEDVEILLLEL